jgi:alpha-amylase
MSSVLSTKNPKNLVLYFQVHQPKRLNNLRFFDIGANRGYFNDALNKEIVQRVAAQCYLPTNNLLLKLIKKFPDLRVAFSISGITIEQLEEYAPEVLDSFRALAKTGSVDFLTETYYHSLASLNPGNEFELQVAKHQKQILRHFGILSEVFRNTELLYSDETGKRIHAMGFKGVMIDGVDRVLQSDSPHYLYEHPSAENLKMLLRNYRLSDDISFRFSQSSSPLTADQYIQWLNGIPSGDEVVNLAMDYETFGEHQKKDSGIFAFLEKLLMNLARHKDYRFLTPSEAIKKLTPHRKLSVSGFISWADEERDVSAWLGNEMQRDAFDSLNRLEGDIKDLHDKNLLQTWRTLQTSDHFYYMSTKKGNDGGVHAYFSPYPSPYEAFINYMNVLTDFSLRVKIHKSAAIIGRAREVGRQLEEGVSA